MNKFLFGKRKVFIVTVTILVITLVLVGSTYALFIFNDKGNINNAKSGNVYLTLNSNNSEINLNNQKPISDEEGINKDNYYEFSVSGFVTGKNPIIYKISVVNGDDVDGLTRFRDSDIKLYLTDEKVENKIQ